MNPLFMMFNPLGFFGGGCGCGFGVNMPYYGQNDMCTFMNFPVFRNTSNDYLLDPRLAMMQTQQSWMNGGGMGFFGNSYLPLFNNFPGMNMPGMNMPGMNNTPWSPWGPQRTETEEEKKQREAREKEDKDPKNVEKKARLESYKEYLNKFKATLSEDEKKKFATVEAKFKEALKEIKVDDRLTKVEELFKEYIDKESLTKIALADKDIDSKLYKAGYNFPTAISAHKKSKVETDLETEATNLDLTNSTKVGEFGTFVKSGDYILPMISTFNSTHSENSILKAIAKQMPNNDTHQHHYKDCIVDVTNALTAKANSFMSDNGGTAAYPKLSEQIRQVNKKLEPIQEVNYQSETKNRVDASDVNALAEEFDKLYAMVRVLEAKALNKKVVDKYAENMNNLIEGSIPEDIIIKETLEDLAAEKITAPTEAELDEIPEVKSGFRVSREKTSMEEIDEIEDAEKRMQALVEGNNKKLKAVAGQDGVYETKTEKEETNAPKRYYVVSDDNNIAEVKLNPNTKEYVVIKGKENVSAVEIGQYTDTVQNIDRYYRAGKIIKSRYVDGVYLSTAVRQNGHCEAFIIRNDQLVKVKGWIDKDGNVKLDNGTTTTIDELTDTDVTEVTSERDIYTKPAAPSAPSQPSKPAQGAQSGNNKTKAATKTKIDINSDAYKLGDDVATTIEGDTEDECYEDVNNALNSVTKDTAFNFLAGFYSHNFHEGIIEYLDDEWEMNSDEYSITLDAKKNLITSFVEFAISKGISENDSRIRTINRILKKYEETEDTKFHHGNWFNFTRGFWNGIASIWGDGKSDNEVIDDKLKSLFNELKKD